MYIFELLLLLLLLFSLKRGERLCEGHESIATRAAETEETIRWIVQPSCAISVPAGHRLLACHMMARKIIFCSSAGTDVMVISRCQGHVVSPSFLPSCHPHLAALKIHWKSLLHTVECTHCAGVCCRGLSEPQWEGSAQQSGKQTVPHPMTAPFVAFNCVTDWSRRGKLVTRSYLYLIKKKSVFIYTSTY